MTFMARWDLNLGQAAILIAKNVVVIALFSAVLLPPLYAQTEPKANQSRLSRDGGVENGRLTKFLTQPLRQNRFWGNTGSDSSSNVISELGFQQSSSSSEQTTSGITVHDALSNGNSRSIDVEPKQFVENPYQKQQGGTPSGTAEHGLGTVEGRLSSAPVKTVGISSAERGVGKASLPLLKEQGGVYDFIHLATEKECKALGERDGESSLSVFIPLRNFKIPETSREGETDSTLSGVEQNASALSSENARVQTETSQVLPVVVSDADSLSNDPLVVFTLDNLEIDEKRLLRDSLDGKWDEYDLLNASLIAEGIISPERREPYKARFERLTETMLKQVDQTKDPLKKTEQVYSFLHNNALYSKYDLTCSSVAASLESGVFNCVSATVLFNCFASRSGLEVAALETTGHAKSRVKFSDSFLDIETTCTNWNRLPDRLRFYGTSDVQNQTASKGIPDAITDMKEGNKEEGASLHMVGLQFSSDVAIDGTTTFELDESAPLGYSFTRSRRPMKEISEVELVATIYYNVGVDCSQEGDYERSVASYIKAAQLAPNNKTILGNLKATLNNWAIDVATKEKKYATAINLTDLGMLIDPEFREFKTNMPIFFHDWVEYLAGQNQWNEVKSVQEEYWRRFPEKKDSKSHLR